MFYRSPIFFFILFCIIQNDYLEHLLLRRLFLVCRSFVYLCIHLMTIVIQKGTFEQLLLGIWTLKVQKRMKCISMCCLNPTSDSTMLLTGTFFSFSPKKLKRVKTPQALQASQAYTARTVRTAALRTACTMLEITSMWSLQRPACNHTQSVLRDFGKILLVSSF